MKNSVSQIKLQWKISQQEGIVGHRGSGREDKVQEVCYSGKIIEKLIKGHEEKLGKLQNTSERPSFQIMGTEDYHTERLQYIFNKIIKKIQQLEKEVLIQVQKAYRILNGNDQKINSP